MSKKVMWYDLETSGLDPKENDIIQFACKIYVNDEIVEQMNEFCQPFNWDSISQEALDVTGQTIEKLKSYQTPQEMFKKIMGMLNRHVSKWDKKDKLYLGGYNVVRFDNNFLSEFFKKNNEKWLVSYTHFRSIDPMVMLHWLNYMDLIDLSNYKLETVCKHFGFEANFHDAYDDIDATIKVYEEVKKMLMNLNPDIL